MGGPPPFYCACAEQRFAKANAEIAVASLISILKAKSNAN
jgi:hypothetical protein